jgi:hypothetical protein
MHMAMHFDSVPYYFQIYIKVGICWTAWSKLHNEELRNLYSSPSIIRMIKSRRMMVRACSMNGGEGECI